LKLSAIQEKN